MNVPVFIYVIAYLSGRTIERGQFLSKLLASSGGKSHSERYMQCIIQVSMRLCMCVYVACSNAKFGSDD